MFGRAGWFRRSSIAFAFLLTATLAASGPAGLFGSTANSTSDVTEITDESAITGAGSDTGEGEPLLIGRPAVRTDKNCYLPEETVRITLRNMGPGRLVYDIRPDYEIVSTSLGLVRENSTWVPMDFILNVREAFTLTWNQHWRLMNGSHVGEFAPQGEYLAQMKVWNGASEDLIGQVPFVIGACHIQVSAGPDLLVNESEPAILQPNLTVVDDANVTGITWDLNPSVDTNGDGILTNDADVVGATPDLVFGDDGNYTATLNVRGFLTNESTGAVKQDIVFVIDSSGSMTTNDPFDLRKDAAETYVSLLAPPDRAAVVDFDENALLVNDTHLGTNYTRVVENIGFIDSFGGTFITTGVEVALNEFQGFGDPRHVWVAILLTDAESIIEDDDILMPIQIARAKALGARIYTIGLNTPPRLFPFMENIAAETGGKFYPTPDPESLESVYRDIARDLGNIRGSFFLSSDAAAIRVENLAPSATVFSISLGCGEEEDDEDDDEDDEDDDGDDDEEDDRARDKETRGLNGGQSLASASRPSPASHLDVSFPVPDVWTKEPGIRLERGTEEPLGTVSIHTPYVFRFPNGTLRMFYDAYPNLGMLSAISVDGLTWSKEPGLRLSDGSHAHVLGLPDGRFRMYFEDVRPGSEGINSAVSTDGLTWNREGILLGGAYRDPIVLETPGGYRMYFRLGSDLESAVSADGLSWTLEPGIRLSGAGEFAIVRQPDGTLVMFYGQGTPAFAAILSARSADGLAWTNDPAPALLPGPSGAPDAGGLLTTSIVEFPGNILRMYYQGAPDTNINLEAKVLTAVALGPQDDDDEDEDDEDEDEDEDEDDDDEGDEECEDEDDDDDEDGGGGGLGRGFLIYGNATDPGSDDLTFTWDWGDGAIEVHTFFHDGVGADPNQSPGGGPANASDPVQHAFATAGTYSVTLTVTDDDGGSVVVTFVLVAS